MLYHFKHIAIASIVFYLSLPVDVAESKRLEEQATNETSSSFDLSTFSAPLLAQKGMQSNAAIERLTKLIKIQFEENQLQEALKTLKETLAIYRKIGDKKGEAQTLYNIGYVYEKEDKHLEALKIYQQALSIHRSIDDKKGEAQTLHNIGLFYQRLNQYAKALDYYQKALEIHRSINGK